MDKNTPSQTGSPTQQPARYSTRSMLPLLVSLVLCLACLYWLQVPVSAQATPLEATLVKPGTSVAGNESAPLPPLPAAPAAPVPAGDHC